VVRQWPELQHQYLDPKRENADYAADDSLASVMFNTDEWRDLYPGYKGTNVSPSRNRRASPTRSSWRK
jgi:hypothetical protein